MEGIGDIALNEGFATDWRASPTQNSPPSQHSIRLMRESLGKTATLSITSRGLFLFISLITFEPDPVSRPASIELGAFINVYGVAGSNLSISIETASTEQKSKQQSYTLSHTWTITYVLLSSCVILIPTVSLGLGLGSHRWGFNANHYLGSPSGTMILGGESKLTTFEFVMHEINQDGTARVGYPLYIGTPDAVEVAESGNEAQVIYGVPGDISGLAP
ncbi:hypothetical protein EDD15DRAFT_2377734 [Pisolithus albus]|nr:hypothetical protein EDD15DRAFT_2377734 [Pisolithus albus]